jgi:hypothetical protein
MYVSCQVSIELEDPNTLPEVVSRVLKWGRLDLLGDAQRDPHV